MDPDDDGGSFFEAAFADEEPGGLGSVLDEDDEGDGPENVSSQQFWFRELWAGVKALGTAQGKWVDIPDPLHGKGDAEAPLVSAGRDALEDTGSEELADNPAQVYVSLPKSALGPSSFYTIVCTSFLLTVRYPRRATGVI